MRGPNIGAKATFVIVCVIAVGMIIALIVNEESRNRSEWKHDWFEECADGQTVLVSVRNSKQVIAVNKLNDDGTPVKCGGY